VLAVAHSGQRALTGAVALPGRFCTVLDLAEVVLEPNGRYTLPLHVDSA